MPITVRTLLALPLLAGLSTHAVAEPALFAARDADTTVYLFGTVHATACRIEAQGGAAVEPGREPTTASPPCADWMSETLRSALAEADELWIETVDVTNEALLAGLILEVGYLPVGQRLTDFMPEAELRTLVAMAGPMADALLPDLELMQPWLVSIILGVASMLDGGAGLEQGVDLALVRLADEMGIPLLGLESGEFQVRLLAGDPLNVQVADLRSTAILLNHGIDVAAMSQWMLGKVWEYWLDGDLEAIGAMTVGDDVAVFAEYEEELIAFLGLDRTEVEAIDRETAALYAGIANPKDRAAAAYERIIGQRNRNWVRQITTMLDWPGTFFVAVGAAHLSGDGAVQVLLQQQGVPVTRVQ